MCAVPLRSRSCILDGKVVACGDDGIAAFERIGYRRHDASVFMWAFDLIELKVTGGRGAGGLRACVPLGPRRDRVEAQGLVGGRERRFKAIGAGGNPARNTAECHRVAVSPGRRTERHVLTLARPEKRVRQQKFNPTGFAPTNLTGPERDDDRRIISGIVHMLQCGAPLARCPPEYAPY
jgi:hypothetical protein